MTTQQSTVTVEQFMDDPIVLRRVADADAQHPPRTSSTTCSVRRWPSGSASIARASRWSRKLADRLGITELNDFNDVVPLLFSHTAFKSYPAALIDNKRFDLMTPWLDKLTSHDLSEVDTEGCTASTSGSTGSTSRRRWR